MAKPIILCAGLFADRHQSLYRALSRDFDVRLFREAGTWPGAKRFQELPFELPSAEKERIKAKVRSHLDSLETPSDFTGERAAVADFLSQQWAQAQYIKHGLETLHARTPVSAVIVTNDHLAPNRALVQGAKALGIPTLYIGHGFLGAGIQPSKLSSSLKDSVPFPITDIVCAESELEQLLLEEHYRTLPHKPEIHVTGAPLDSKPETARPANRASGGDEALLLYCASWVEASRLQDILFGDWAEHHAFARFCATVESLQERYPEKQFRAVIKLHPTLVNNVGINNRGYFEAVAQARSLPIEVVDSGPVSIWLDRADLVVTSNASSVTWEAFMGGVPSMTYLSPHLKNLIEPSAWEQPNMLSEWHVQQFLPDEADWPTHAAALLEQKWSGAFGARCDSLFASMRFRNAEESAQNVAQLLRRYVPDGLQPSVSRRLNILQVVHNFPPYSYAGTELYTFMLARELQALGHHVTVLYPVNEPQRPANHFHQTLYEGILTVQFNTAHTRHHGSDWLNPTLDQPFADFLAANQFDVIHFQHLLGLSASWIPLAKQTDAAVLLKLDDMFFYCPQIHLNHRDGSYCSGPENLDKCQSCVYGPRNGRAARTEADIFHLLAYRRAYLQDVFTLPDLIHTPSEFLRRTCQQHGFANANFEVLPTGIDPYAVAPKASRPSGRIQIGFLGAIAKRKGIHDFIAAIDRFNARNPDSPLDFVIHGQHFGDDCYHATLDATRRHSNVTYRGPFTGVDRPRILSEIDLLVVPSIGENYPFILREALFANVPVVGTEIAGVPEIIEDGKNGFLFPPGDVTALADIFERIAADPEILARLDPAAHPIKTIATEAREIEDRYRQLLERLVGMGPRVSIVIPLYNKVEFTEKCLEALIANTPQDLFEVILVDNGSTDGTRALLESLEGDVKIIRNPQNLGFAKACNQGAGVAAGKYLLFLNNDTEAQGGWLEPLIEVLEREPDVGAVGSRLLYPDGTLQHAGVEVTENQLQGIPLYVSHRFHRQPATYPPAMERTDLLAITGASLLIRAEVFRDIGGFDEGYWNGYEDLDLCFNLVSRDWRVVYEPASCLIHHESISGPERFSKNRENDERLHQKWTGRIVPDTLLKMDGTTSPHPDRRIVRQAPVATPKATLPDRRGFNILAVDLDTARLKVGVEEYLRAFDASHDVAFHVLLPDGVDEAQEIVIRMVSELGLDIERIPDISLLGHAPLGEVDAYLRVADLVVGPPDIAARARKLRRPAVTAPSAEGFAAALETFAAYDWEAAPLPLDSTNEERWLVSSPDGWQEPLSAFVHTTVPQAPISLILRAEPGQAEQLGQAIATWLQARGIEPDHIGDVLIVDPPVRQEIALFRQATHWIDTGNVVGQAIADALGLPTLQLKELGTASPSAAQG